MAIEFGMRHLNSNALCAIAIEVTGEDSRRCDIVEICVMLLDNFIRPSNEIFPFYNQICPFRPEAIDFKTATCNKEKIKNAGIHGMEPSMAADRLEEWVMALDLPQGKGIVPLTYNWPLVREYLHTWLGTKNFNFLFNEQYRDVMSATLFINDSRNQKGETIPLPRPDSLAYLCALNGQELRITDDVMIRCQVMAELYRLMLGIRT